VFVKHSDQCLDNSGQVLYESAGLGLIGDVTLSLPDVVLRKLMVLAIN